ncbi:uncharacterized protein LOC128556416 isoform X2 [Mercenaria mercenaria]|uniref:uncharacterized protein LOC128556416 isoform X2 n=1 Tax=Mercenaria mercenaria TaxID=6596 RepID=UPI00234E673D|nr:uncharacterized protein LOC128556416 isoform X2 [Mercenaria mercenaria]
MATGGNELASDEIGDFQCLTCTNKTAVKYCVECQGNCCQVCVDTHSRFPTLKGHTLLDKSNCQTPGVPAKLPEVPTERCRIHTIKLLDMYCKDHDEVGCTTCMALDHRSCINVHSIPDDIDSLFEASDIKDISQNLQRSKEAFLNITQKKDALLEGLNSSKTEANTAVDDSRKEIVAIVDSLANKSKEEIENLYQTTKTLVEKERKEASHYVGDLEKFAEDIQRSDGNKAQQFVCMKIANRKIKDAKTVDLSLDSETEAKVTFSMDSNLQVYFRTLKEFGKVTSLVSKAERTEVYTVEKCKTINVKLQKDSSSCQIFGSCLNEDGPVLLVDYNNKKLKRANITNMAVDGYCTFDNYPYSVCCTSRQEAVVTFYSYTQFIQFVTIGDQLTLSRKVQTNHHCLGIAFKEDRLYITDNSNTIYIHDMAGNELQAISQDSSGNGLFSCTRHIAFKDVTQGVFVADWYKGVIILDKQFQPVATFIDSGLSNASGVSTDRNGNIFVCGYNSDNVLQTGYDGKKRGVVVDKSHGVQTTRSVCFDPIQCRLIVTQHNDVVKIYYLK